MTQNSNFRIFIVMVIVHLTTSERFFGKMSFILESRFGNVIPKHMIWSHIAWYHMDPYHMHHMIWYRYVFKNFSASRYSRHLYWSIPRNICKDNISHIQLWWRRVQLVLKEVHSGFAKTMMNAFGVHAIEHNNVSTWWALINVFVKRVP